MKQRIIITFTVLFAACCRLFATDSISVLSQQGIFERVHYNNSLAYNFLTAGYTNPAVKKLMPAHTLTQLSAEAEYQNLSEALIMQQGKNYHKYNVTTQSHVNCPKYTVWGKAYYQQGKRENVKWNESSDYHIVYPYVMADTAGGDMKFENYYFSGGYARDVGQLTWGIYGEYRAALECRTVDPRPRNSIGDLKFSAGAMYNVFNYNMGIAASYRRYKQNSGISFFSPEGKIPVFHFIGMGMLYSGQGSGELSQYYKGNDFGINLSFIPCNNNGFAGSFSYNIFSFDKAIDAMNDFPLNHVNEHVFNGEILYHKNMKYGVKLQFMHKNRKGTENLPGSPVDGIYPVLVSVQQYGNSSTNVLLTLLYNNKAKLANAIGWAVQPKFGYTKTDFKYKSPLSKMQVSNAMLGFDVEASKQMFNNKGLLKLAADFIYSKNIDSDILLNNNGGNSINTMMMSNYNTLSSSYQHYGVLLNYNHKIDHKSTVFVKALWYFNSFSNNTLQRFYQFSLGYLF